MKRVDTDPSRVKKNLVNRGYRVPELAALISGQTPKCRKLLMTNWLAILPLLISQLDHDPPPHTIPYPSTVEGDPPPSTIQRRAQGCIRKQHGQKNGQGS
jgi:hypothetical protein